MSFKMKGFPQIAGTKEIKPFAEVVFNVDPTNPNEMPDQDGDGISDYIDADPTTPYSAEEAKKIKNKKNNKQGNDKKLKTQPEKQTRYIKHKGHDTTPSYNLG
tara:strand:+ start:16 stop:324 length:309 start_codon:yes stop_codon:yes gene_type:complete